MTVGRDNFSSKTVGLKNEVKISMNENDLKKKFDI